MSTYETELGEFGETSEFGETEFGEFGEFGELGETEFGEFGETGGEFGEFGEFGETGGEFGEFGELGETEFGEFGETSEYGEAEQFLDGILGTIGSLIGGGEVGTPLSEAQEVELASELLEIGNEQELEQFLGNLFKSVARGVGGFIKSPIGQSLGGILKNVAKKALPMVGGALGSMVAPGIGTALGSKLGSMASGLFEVELESMPQEQAEFEVARRLVNLAATSAAHAARAQPRPGISPRTVARAAVAAAARQHAPGVYRAMMQSLQSTAPAAVARRQNGHPAVRMGAPGYRRPGPVGPGRSAGVPPGRRMPSGRPVYYGRPGVQRVPRPGMPPQRPGVQRVPRPGVRGGRRPYQPGQWWWGGYEPAPEPWGVEPEPYTPVGPAAPPAAAAAPAPAARAGAPGYGPSYGPTMSGRWIRRGRKIIVFGA